MKFPVNKRDTPGSKALAMDKALGSMQEELPHIFKAVQALISFNKACSNLKMSSEDMRQCAFLKEGLKLIIEKMNNHYKVNPDVIKMFDALIEKESGG